MTKLYSLCRTNMRWALASYLRQVCLVTKGTGFKQCHLTVVGLSSSIDTFQEMEKEWAGSFC